MIRATTIIAIKKDKQVAMAGDGQVTFGDVVFKNKAKKIRKIKKYNVLCGFAGAAADAFALMGKFEKKLEEFNGDLKKSAVELASFWREDKALRVLDAMLIVADINTILILSGNGDVIEPDDDIAAIGSGGNYALAGAKGLLTYGKDKSAQELAIKSMEIASSICIYTNSNINCEVI